MQLAALCYAIIIYALFGFALVKYFVYFNFIWFCDLFAQGNSPCHDPAMQKLSSDFPTFNFAILYFLKYH